MLEIKNLTKYYGKKLGVKNVTLTINDGDMFGFIGPNGAGKSTTIKCILNMLYPNNGEILLDGNIITDELKKEIGYLPSEVHLYESCKVKDIINYNDTFYKHDTLTKANKLIKLLDIDVNKKIEELSLGNLKKVGIVLALMHSPKLLILDEPTSGLDPIVQERFFNILKEEQKRGTTIFFSSHNLSEIKKICNKVAIIKNGRIIEVNEVENLKQKNFVNIKIMAKGITKVKFNLKKIRIKKMEEDYIECSYYDTIDSFIKLVCGLDIEQLLIEEPSLEELFMHYYKEENHD